MYITYWTVLTPTPLSIWTMEAPSKITTLAPSVNFFKGGSNASKPVCSFITKTMRNTRHSSTAPPPQIKTNEMLSYPHKINWRTLTNVCYGSFTGSMTLETYFFKTVHWQLGDSPSTDSDMRFGSSSTAKYTCLPACLSVFESVCLWPVTYIRYVTGLA